MKSVTKLHRSSAIQASRDLLVRDFHPLVIRAARAHVVLQIGRAERRQRSCPVRSPAYFFLHADNLCFDLRIDEGSRRLAAVPPYCTIGRTT